MTKFDKETLDAMRAMLELRAFTEMVRDRTPARSIGTDPDEVIEAVVDQAGTLVELKIESRWKSRVGPSALGSAVLAAITASYEDQQRTLASLPGRFTPPAVSDAEVLAALEESITQVSDGLEFGPRVDLNEAAEDYLKLAKGEGAPTGSSGSGPVSVTLRAGRVVDVSIDPSWAASVPVFSISAAVIAAAMSPGDGDDEVDDLLFSVLSTLTQMRREA